MGYNRKSAAILSSNKQTQLLHSRKTFHSKNKTKPQQKKGNIFLVPPQREIFTTKLLVVRKRKKKKTTQGRNGNQTHLSHTRRERWLYSKHFGVNAHVKLATCLYNDIVIYDVFKRISNDMLTKSH